MTSSGETTIGVGMGVGGDVALAARSRARALLVVSRYEFMPGGVFFIFASAALATLTWSALGNRMALVGWGAAVWYLSHLIGSHVNCLADAELDREGKPRLSAAVARFGPARLMLVIAVEIVAAIAVTIHMAVVTGRWLLPFLWLMGLVLAVAYSAEPLRLKRRGWLNPLSLLFVLYALPMAYGYLALAPEAHADAVGVLIATGLQMLGVILLNPAEDIATDRAAGVETPCVRYGLQRVAPLAALSFLIGTVAALWFFLQLAGGQGEATVAALALPALGQAYVLQELMRLASLSRDGWPKPGSGRDRKALTRLVKRNPLHFALLGTTLAIASGLVLR